MNVQLCLVTGSWGDVSFETQVRAAAGAGFTCLDLWLPAVDAYLAAYPLSLLEDLLRTHGTYPTIFSGMEPLALRPQQEYLLVQSHFVDLCARFDALGGGTVVVYPGLRTGKELSVGNSEQAMIAELSYALRELSALAAPFEVNVAFEFCSGSGSSAHTLAQAQEIVRQTARGNVGLALSTLHFYLSGGVPEEMDRLDAGQPWLVRLGDTRGAPGAKPCVGDRVPVGRGVIPLREICGQLAARGFRGPYSVELFPQRRPILEAAQAARKAALDVLSFL
jgi:sugar phosphate isomerase/epimerase